MARLQEAKQIAQEIIKRDTEDTNAAYMDDIETLTIARLIALRKKYGKSSEDYRRYRNRTKLGLQLAIDIIKNEEIEQAFYENDEIDLND